jgi:hypothetical protein
MGFTRCVVPEVNAGPREPHAGPRDSSGAAADLPAGCEVIGIRTVSEALDQLIDW